MKEGLHALAQYNAQYKRQDKLYRDAARRLGVSDSRFWILYTLLESRDPITQGDIVDMAFLPPQTVNSALKKMEKEGLLSMTSTADKRKKRLTLTPEGTFLACQTAGQIFLREKAAMESLREEEQRQFLFLLKKYVDSLTDQFGDLRQEAL